MSNAFYIPLRHPVLRTSKRGMGSRGLDNLSWLKYVQQRMKDEQRMKEEKQNSIF